METIDFILVSGFMIITWINVRLLFIHIRNINSLRRTLRYSESIVNSYERNL